MLPDALVLQLQRRSRLTLRRIIPAGQSVYLEAEQGLFSLDPSTQMLHRVTHIDNKELLSITSFQQRPLALCRDAQRLLLLHQLDNAWQPIELPEVLRVARKARPSLIANDSTIVLLQSGSLAFYRDNQWKLSPWRKEEPSLLEYKKYLLIGDLLWIATNRGEFGGGLVSYHLINEQVIPTPNHFGVRATPVTALRQNPGGALWFSEGISSLGRERGGLFRQKNDSFETFFYGSHLPPQQLMIIHPTTSWQERTDKEREQLLHSFTDWNLPSCSIDSFAFTPDGTPIVLTARFGPVSFDGQDWSPMLNNWPFTQTADILALNDTILIATRYAGLLLWNTSTNQFLLSRD